MMYLIPDPVVTKQVSGNVESSPSRPSPSKSFQHAEKSSPSLLSYAKSPSSHRRRYYSSDEEDDSRDRQSHWKRIKTRPDDNPRGSTRNLIRYTERDYENSPPRIRLQAPPQSPKPRPSANPRPGHRVIVLKGNANEKDVGLRRLGHESSGGRTGSESKALGGAVGMRMRDGGTASTNISLGGNKRKQDLMLAFGNASRSSLMMSERSMVVREKLTARRAPVEKGHEFRVSDREVGEFVYGEDDDSLFLEDSRQFYDDHPPRSMSGSDLREILNRRGRAEEAMSREARVYGDYRTAERGDFDAGVRVRRVEFDLSAGNGKVQGSTVRKVLDLGRSSRSGNDDSKERASVGTGGLAAIVGPKSERDMESERRQEKRERWAEKERDLEKELEKENMLKAAQQAKVKSVTVVDYSHKFTVAKAPISVPTKAVETDPHRLCQRQKQIDYGKNTLGYERYTDMIPRYQRTKAHPRTPDIRQVCSKRSWDGQIRKWRRLLHEFDPPKDEDEEDPEQMLVLRREPVRSTEYVEDTLMDMQAEYVEDQDLKIYEGWSDDEC